MGMNERRNQDPLRRETLEIGELLERDLDALVSRHSPSIALNERLGVYLAISLSSCMRSAKAGAFGIRMQRIILLKRENSPSNLTSSSFPYAVVAYWIKYIDQTNLNNAYVAGLKEDLGFYSNELVNLNAMYTVGAVVGQLPFTFIFPMFPMNYTIPALEAGWGLFTLLQFRTQSYVELMAHRFCVGLFETAFFLSSILCWVHGIEARRSADVAAYSMLDRCPLRAGDGCLSSLTILVAIAGVYIWPNTPAKPNNLVLTDSELASAIKRLEERRTDTKEVLTRFRWQVLRKIVTGPRIYLLTFWDILFWNSGSTSTGAYLLWLKSLNRFNVPRVTQLGTAPALGIFYVLFVNFSSDLDPPVPSPLRTHAISLQ
ncbi:hypothetical protein VTO42DRAFT_5942 [Malbranchea cinnamomea]